MLLEVVVKDLGVIEQVSVLPGAKMTALTGETGAGKTLIVEALTLLLGGRAESMMVRSGADEARVDGRFEFDGHERVLTRVIGRNGRSRAYIDGHPVTVAQLSEVGAGLVDIHGQHAHQSLTGLTAQRDALDAFGRVDRSALVAARAKVASIDERLASLGGDERTRMREIDLLRFQLHELDAANLVDPGEDRALNAEEELLAGALQNQEAGSGALDALRDEDGTRDSLAAAVAMLGRRGPFTDVASRLTALLVELDDVIAQLRDQVESIEDNPQRLAEVRARRQLLRDLIRKYAEDVESVIAFREEARHRLAELSSHDAMVADLTKLREEAVRQVVAAAATVRAARLAAAQPLAAAVQKRLSSLAMPKAKLSIDIDESVDATGADEGADVKFLFAANPGSPLLPLAKVASGGELARSMLALRLALLEGRVALGGIPDTLVFDEVDAGIGGATALAVGDALAELGKGRQVIVVTHLAQVAARASQHLTVEKRQKQKSTSTSVRLLSDDERVAEIARMLGGKADSEAGQQHARELLAVRKPTSKRSAQQSTTLR
jgi:DNA repair protein RecN (Recombination protein N)